MSALVVSGCFMPAMLLETKPGNDVMVDRGLAPPDPDMLVLGQPNFYTVSANNTARPQSSTYSALRAIKSIGSRIWVMDTSNNRILVYDGAITNSPAFVLGQPDFTSAIPNNSQTGVIGASDATTLYNPSDLVSDGTRLIVADASNSRVLIWNSIPTRSGQPADVVLGQADFTGRFANRGLSAPTASTMSAPAGVALSGGKLIVSDSSNHRILIFNSIPTASGVAADMVIGQADFVSNGANRGATPTANSLNFPFLITTSGTKLLVSDYSNSRVLIWNSIPGALDVNADVVLGQAAFTTNAGATTQAGLKFPRSTLVVGGALYIADGGNGRMIYHSAIPAVNGQAATGMWGQSLFTNGAGNRGAGIVPAANSLAYPTGLYSDGTSLWIADSGNYRLLKYNTLPTPATEPQGDAVTADAVYGQPTMTTGFPNQITSPNNVGFSKTPNLCIYGNSVVVPDMNNQRYLIFDRSNPAAGAVAVIGQADFTSNSINRGGAAAANTIYISNSDASCAFDSRGRLYLADTFNHRVLEYDTVPTTNGTAANFVFGQPDMTTTAAGCTATGLAWPSGLHIVNDRLVVADYSNNRTLVFNLNATLDNVADVVIGEPNFTTCGGGTSSTLAALPWSVTSDGTRLFIVEYSNNRIMVYNSVPTSNGVAADYVIGQPDFTSVQSATTASRFLRGTYGGIRSTPAVVDGMLVVPDYMDYRMLAFDLSQLASGMSAKFVFGQSDFTTGTSSTGRYGNMTNTAWSGFYLPLGIIADPDGKYVWVSDYNRIFRVRRSMFWKYGTM